MISQEMNEQLCKIFAYFIIILSPFAITYTIAKDDLLYHYLRYVSLMCILVTIGCCLVNLSDAIKLRRKKSAKQVKVDDLTDFDLDFEDGDIPVEKIIFNFKCILPAIRNVIQFYKGRDNYALILNFGICFIVASVMIMICLILNLPELKHLKGDLSCSAVMLLCQGLALAISCLFLCNLPEACHKRVREDYNYRPFDKTIKVPMRVIVAKITTVFLDDGIINTIKLTLGIALFSFGIYFSRSVPESSQLNVKWWKTTEMHNVYHALVGLIYFVIFSGIVLVVHVLYSTYRRAKQNMLAIIEQNWQRNLRAIQFLLPDQKTTTLEQLVHHLNGRRNKRLTSKEKEALTYIDLPMWKWKNAFSAEIRT